MPLQRTINRLHEKVVAKTEERALQLQSIAVELHDNAPRGGSYLNAFGEPRSAPGEQPAVEYGELMGRMLEPIAREGDSFLVVVNRVRLEFGSPTENLAPRPMGDMALQALRNAVINGTH